MNILISGGTGLVGNKLVKRLIQDGHHAYVLTRSPETYQDTATCKFISYKHTVKELPTIDAVINLAGESIFGYWSKTKKESILTSRITTTEKLLEMIQQMPNKPTTFINASAIGFYGTSDELIFTEETTCSGKDFLAQVVLQWENTAKRAMDFGMRTIFVRFGVILSNSGGALPLMSLPVKLFLGGKISNGEQWISWIHIDDCIELLLFALDNELIHGPLNITAPKPLRNQDFMNVLASALKRPAWLTTPALALRLTMGEMSELVTKGQFVLPKKAQDHGFSFSFPHLEGALKQILMNATTEKN